MHFSVIAFHRSDIDGLVAKRSYDATEEDGAHIEFNAEFTLEGAEKEYKQYIKDNPQDKKTYASVEDFMTSYYGHELEDGAYGNRSNSDGMYDWYEVGGRWSNLLPDFTDKKYLKERLKKALDMKNKEAYDMFRDNADLYVKLKEMPLEEACTFLKIGGSDSITISEKVSPEMILDWWISSYKNGDDAGLNKNTYTRKNIISDVTEYFLIEEEGGTEELTQDVDMQSFIDTYNYFAKLNKKLKGFDKFQITFIDMHT